MDFKVHRQLTGDTIDNHKTIWDYASEYFKENNVQCDEFVHVDNIFKYIMSKSKGHINPKLVQEELHKLNKL